MCRFAQPSQRIVLDIIDARLDIKMSIPNPLDSAPTKRDLPSWWPVPSSGLRPGVSPTSYDSVPIVGTVVEFTGVGRSGLGMQSVCPLRTQLRLRLIVVCIRQCNT